MFNYQPLCTHRMLFSSVFRTLCLKVIDMFLVDVAFCLWMVQDSLVRENVCEHSFPSNLNEIEKVGFCTASEASIMDVTYGLSQQSKGIFLFSTVTARSAINSSAEDLEVGVVNSPPNRRRSVVNLVSSPRLPGQTSTCREAFPANTEHLGDSGGEPCTSPWLNGLACTFANNVDAIGAVSSRFMAPSSTAPINKVLLPSKYTLKSNLDDAGQLHRSRPHYSNPNPRRSKVSIDSIQASETRSIQQQWRHSSINPTSKQGKFQMEGFANNSRRAELMKWLKDVQDSRQ